MNLIILCVDVRNEVEDGDGAFVEGFAAVASVASDLLSSTIIGQKRVIALGPIQFNSMRQLVTDIFRFYKSE